MLKSASKLCSTISMRTSVMDRTTDTLLHGNSGSGFAAHGGASRTLKVRPKSSSSPMKMSFLSMDVKRPIVAVSKIVAAGNHVVFAPENEGGSYIYVAETGEYKKVYQRNGVYEIPLWIKGTGEQEPFAEAPCDDKG